jgi:hypothetical protein
VPKKKLPVDKNEIYKLSAIGCTAEEIAVLLELPGWQKRVLDAQGIERRYYATMRRGRMELHRALKSQLVQMALRGNTAACIFALKCYCGLRDRDSDEPGRYTGPIVVTLTPTQAKVIEMEAEPIQAQARELLSNYRPENNGNGTNGDVTGAA